MAIGCLPSRYHRFHRRDLPNVCSQPSSRRGFARSAGSQTELFVSSKIVAANQTLVVSINGDKLLEFGQNELSRLIRFQVSGCLGLVVTTCVVMQVQYAASKLRQL